MSNRSSRGPHATFSLIGLLAANLRYHARTQIAIALAVFAGATALTGALLVGDSMRGSLRDLALRRLDGINDAVRSPRFFSAGLAERVSTAAHASAATVAPLIILPCSASQPDSGARSNRVTLVGADARFAGDAEFAKALAALTGRSGIVNASLAADLGVKAGDDIVVRVGKAAAISSETLMGRRDDATANLRLTIRAVIQDQGRGGFSLDPRQETPRNLFVPLEIVQRAIGQAGRANVIVVQGAENDARANKPDWNSALRQVFTLADAGVKVCENDEFGYVALESDALLIAPTIEMAAREGDASISPIISYLANEIRLDEISATAPTSDGTHAPIPYSTVAAIDPAHPPASRNLPAALAALRPGEIVLNEWAARELGATVGQRITLRYYVTPSPGTIDTRDATFTLSAIVPISGAAADPGFVPEYPGLSDVKHMSDWDPPFPVDLKKIHDRDEAYWDAHRTTPKAFVHIDDGRRLWAEQEARFGEYTSLRRLPVPAERVADVSRHWQAQLLAHLDPSSLGLQFQPVRALALAAGEGNTDFGGLFIGFSFFLIISSALLVGLIFRLGVEQRAREIGLLLSLGFARREVRRLLLAEGLLTASFGCEAGLLGAVGYGWLMLAGLRGWWSDAVNAPFLELHVSPTSLAIGVVGSMIVAGGAILLALRGITRQAPRNLMAGAVEAGDNARGGKRPSFRVAGVLCITTSLTAIGLTAAGAAGAIPASAAFFGGAVSALVAALAGIRVLLSVAARDESVRPGRGALARLAWRGAARRPSRSLTTIGLIASASFLIVSLGAFKMDAPDSEQKQSGTGGFSLIAEATTPLLYDLSTADGQDKLGLTAETRASLAKTEIIPLRLKPGDETSCLSLYRATRPRILGAPVRLIERGGFEFSARDAKLDPAAAANPWALLNHRFEDGAIAAIGDDAAVLWQLHSDVGQDYVITDEHGRRVPLRFVALLSGSMLQNELIVSESNFIRLFPGVSGHSFFLISAPRAARAGIERGLEHDLAPFSLDVTSASQRLADYLRVQNTYISTFQMLGGLGLALGVIGLAAVLLRSVTERRRELALLLALGYRRGEIGRLVFLEHAALIALGLLAGVGSATLAIAPTVFTRPAEIPWGSLSATLAIVLVAGVGATLAALRPALRAPLMPALRSE